MLRRDQMPKDNAELADLEVDFPHVPLANVMSPRTIEPRLLEYLGREGFPPDDDGLTFLRTAQVESTVYWIWELMADGEKVYAVATQNDKGGTAMSCNSDYSYLTPEQFILADYYKRWE